MVRSEAERNPAGRHFEDIEREHQLVAPGQGGPQRWWRRDQLQKRDGGYGGQDADGEAGLAPDGPADGECGENEGRQGGQFDQRHPQLMLAACAAEQKCESQQETRRQCGRVLLAQTETPGSAQRRLDADLEIPAL